MIKKLFLAITLMLSVAGIVQANNTPVYNEQDTTILENQVLEANDTQAIDLDNLDPNIDVSLPSEPKPSAWFKLRLFKEYLILQAELAKQHVIDNKETYLLAAYCTGCVLAALGSAYFATQKSPTP